MHIYYIRKRFFFKWEGSEYMSDNGRVYEVETTLDNETADIIKSVD